jgi:hypothetical protein
MIWVLDPDPPRPTESAPAMDESTGILPGLPSVMGKPVHVAFDGGRMTSDAGILLPAAIEQRLGIAERLADCIEDPGAPERVRHGLAEMIRCRALPIAAGYPDGNDCDVLKSDAAFKMVVGRLPERDRADRCSQPTISRLKKLPPAKAGARETRSAAAANSAMPQKAGRSSAASPPASRPDPRACPGEGRGCRPPQPAPAKAAVTNLRGLPKALSAKKSAARAARPKTPAFAGAGSDQSPQAPPRPRPNLLHQGRRQPIPAADPHRRLPAEADPARAGAPGIVLVRCPVRRDPPWPDQARRPGQRDGHPDQTRPADRVPLPNRPRHARQPHRQAAAVNDGVNCAAVQPRTNPSAQPQTPIIRVPGATENHVRKLP